MASILVLSVLRFVANLTISEDKNKKNCTKSEDETRKNCTKSEDEL